MIVAPIPWPCSNADYEAAMKRVCDHALEDGITAIAFGDLFLTDVRAYRERQLKDTGLEPLFPLWGLPTRELAEEMISAGLRAKLVCVDPRQLASDFVGRDFDETLLRDLPAGSIHAEKTASSILLSMRGQCSAGKCSTAKRSAGKFQS